MTNPAPLTLHVISIAHPAFIPARVEDANHFTVLTTNLINTLRQARVDVDDPKGYAPTIKHLEVLFMNDLGVNAGLLEEVAQTASDNVIKFELLPNGVPSDTLLFNPHKPAVLLTHGKTRQHLQLHPYPLKNTPIVLDFHNKPKDTEARDKWIGKAVRHDATRFDKPYYDYHWGDFAGDSFRFHLDPALEHIEREDVMPVPDEVFKLLDGFRGKRARWATFNSKELQQAVKRAGKIAKIGNGAVTIKIWNRPTMDVFAKSETTGVSLSKVKVKYTGRDVELHVNPKYMLDALSGMTGEVSMKIGHMSIYLKCGVREAFIAQLNIA